VGRQILIQDENQTEAMDHLLAFNTPKGHWRIRRPDGWYFKVWNAVREFTPDVDAAADFHTQSSAQHLIDLSQNTEAGRKAFRGCTAVCVLEPGDHVVCACGQLHEADYCPTAAGHGVVL
jgi:hypothetical protein